MTKSKNGRNWYLIFTKPRMEQQAVEHLERQGYSTYLPLMAVTRRQRGRYREIIEPCFPRYLFIHLNTGTDNWAPIRSTVGVSRLVEFGGIPAIVPDELIRQLQDHEDENGLQRPPEPMFQPGDPVTVMNGPLTGVRGIFQAAKGSYRVAVLLDIVGKNTLTTLTIHDLKHAEGE